MLATGKKKKASAVKASDALEVMGPRGKDVSITTEKAVKQAQKAVAQNDEWEESDPTFLQAERLIEGKGVVQLVKNVEVDTVNDVPEEKEVTGAI